MAEAEFVHSAYAKAAWWYRRSFHAKRAWPGSVARTLPPARSWLAPAVPGQAIVTARVAPWREMYIATARGVASDLYRRDWH